MGNLNPFRVERDPAKPLGNSGKLAELDLDYDLRGLSLMIESVLSQQAFGTLVSEALLFMVIWPYLFVWTKLCNFYRTFQL